MSIFFPAWKTTDRRKMWEITTSINKIDSVPKLCRIILRAPLAEARSAAVGHLQTVSGGQFRLPPEESKRQLLLLDASGNELSYWYVEQLVLSIPDEKELTELVRATKNDVIHQQAIYAINAPGLLCAITLDSALPEKTRVRAVERISDQKALQSVVMSDAGWEIKAAAAKRIDDQQFLRSLIWSDADAHIRAAAVKRLNDGKELRRIRDESDSTIVKQAVCERLGHRLTLVNYVPHGQGGKDALYRCEICGYTQLQPYEWSTADSV